MGKLQRFNNNETSGFGTRMKLFIISLALLIGAVLLGGSLGCHRGLTLIPTTGEVKLDNQPLADCAITFTPVGGGPVASAATDAQGRFQLSTVNRPGVVPGEHHVTLTKQRMTYGSDGRELAYEFLIPQEYARPNTSGLKKTVDGDNHEFVFEISSKP